MINCQVFLLQYPHIAFLMNLLSYSNKGALDNNLIDRIMPHPTRFTVANPEQTNIEELQDVNNVIMD